MLPFFVNMGYHPWKAIENAVESCNKAANKFAESGSCAGENPKNHEKIL
jgi:hypothetical protein